MGKLTILLLAIYSHGLWAYSCPPTLQSQPQTARLQAWLERWQGQMKIGDCHVEITACELGKPPGMNSVIGELYILDGSGREVYLPITFLDQNQNFGNTQIQIYEKRLFYKKSDYLYEQEYGRTEVYRLDIRINNKNNIIRAIDLGTYSTNRRLRMPDGNQSRWYNCGDSQ